MNREINLSDEQQVVRQDSTVDQSLKMSRRMFLLTGVGFAVGLPSIVRAAVLGESSQEKFTAKPTEPKSSFDCERVNPDGTIDTVRVFGGVQLRAQVESGFDCEPTPPK